MSTLFENATRFFGRQQKKLLSFLHLLKQEISRAEKLLFLLPCLEEARQDAEMLAAPQGLDSLDAGCQEKSTVFDGLSSVCESLEPLLLAQLQQAVAKSFFEFGKLFPELEAELQQSGLQCVAIQSKDGVMCMSPTIAPTKTASADVPSSSHLESKSPAIKATSNRISGVKREATLDQFLEQQSKKPTMNILPIYSGM